MKNCKEIQGLLSEYIDGVLNKEAVPLVEEHIGRCQVCRAELEKLRAASSMLKGMKKEEPPKDFLQQVHGRIEQRKSLNSFLKGLFKKPNVKAPVAVGVMVLLVITVYRVIQLPSASRKLQKQEMKVASSKMQPESKREDRAVFPEQRKEKTDNSADVTVRKGINKKVKKSPHLSKQMEAPTGIGQLVLTEGAADKFAKLGISPEYTLTIHVYDTEEAVKRIKDILAELNIESFYPAGGGLNAGYEDLAPSGQLAVKLSDTQLNALVEAINKTDIAEVTFYPPSVPSDEPFVLKIGLESD